MTEACAAAGRPGLSVFEGEAAGEAVLVDRLIDLLLALEPFEIKQSAAPVVQAGDAGTRGAAEDACEPAAGTAMVAPRGPVAETLAGADAGRVSAESTRAMLARMRAVLDREAGRLGDDGLEGKAAVDQVALIARTLEKIDQMERLIAEDQARARGERLAPEEREQLRLTVRQLILSAAERLAAEQARDQPSQRGRAVEMSDGEKGTGFPGSDRG